MPGPNDPFAALSPFSEVTSPEEQFALDMADTAAPADMTAIDMTPGSDGLDPAGFPTLDQFNQDTAPESLPFEPQPEADFAEEETAIGQLPFEDEVSPIAEESALGQLPFEAPADAEWRAAADEEEFQRPDFTGFGAGELAPPEISYGAQGEELPDQDVVLPPDSDVTDAEFQRREYERGLDREDQQRELQNEAIAKDRAYQERNQQIREDSNAKAESRLESIYAESKAISEKGVDNDRWFNSRSTGQTIALYVAAAIGGQEGLTSGRGGNDTMDLIQGAIDNDIASQKFDIQNQRAGLKEQRGLVAEIYEKTGDMYQAEETARLAIKQGISVSIANEMAMLDPEGDRARKSEAYKRQVDASARSSFEKTSQVLRKQGIEDGEFQIKREEQDRKNSLAQFQMAKLKAEADKLARRRGRGGKKTGVKKALSANDQVKYRGQYEPFTVDGLLVPVGGEAAEALRNRAPDDLKTRKLAAETERAETLAGREDRSETVFVRGKAMVNEDGTKWKPPTVDEAKAMRTMITGVNNMQRASDLLIDMRHKYGGASKWAGTKEYQEMVSIVRAMDLEAGVRFNLGALSADDIKNIKDVRGGSDIHSFIQDPTHGLRSMAKRANEKINTRMEDLGYTGPKFKPVRSQIAGNSERSEKGLREEIAKPIRPDQTPGDYVKSKSLDMGVWMKRKPSITQIEKMGKSLKERADNDELDLDTAETLAGQMRSRYEQLQAGKNPDAKKKPEPRRGKAPAWAKGKGFEAEGMQGIPGVGGNVSEDDNALFQDHREFLLHLAGE